MPRVLKARSKELEESLQELSSTIVRIQEKLQKTDDLVSTEECAHFLRSVCAVVSIAKLRDPVPFGWMHALRSIDRRYKVGTIKLLQTLLNKVCSLPVSPLVRIWREVEKVFPSRDDVFLVNDNWRFRIEKRPDLYSINAALLPKLHSFQKAFEVVNADNPDLVKVEWADFFKTVWKCTSIDFKRVLPQLNSSNTLESDFFTDTRRFHNILGYAAYLDIRREQEAWLRGEYRQKAEGAVVLFLVLHDAKSEARLREVMLLSPHPVKVRQKLWTRIQNTSSQTRVRERRKKQNA